MDPLCWIATNLRKLIKRVDEMDARLAKFGPPGIHFPSSYNFVDAQFADNFLHISKKIKHMPHDDDEKQCEHGDVKTHAFDAHTSDFTPHQFIAEMFDSEDVPSPDKFLQTFKKIKHMPHDENGEQYEYGGVATPAIDAYTSVFSPHQFISPDEARDPMFDSEDVPSPDNFSQGFKKIKHMPHDRDGEQHEYGDTETPAVDAYAPDFSPHQFIAPDKARDPMGSDTEQNAPSNDVLYSQIHR